MAIGASQRRASGGPGGGLVEVRDVRPSEHLAAGTVTLAAYRALPGAHLSDGYARELADVATRARGAHVIVAAEDGRVLGTATYVADPASPYAELLGPGEAGLRMLAVDPAAQGRGVGAALVAACVARARSDRAERLVLHTPWMETAHRLYERAGFRRAPARDWAPVPEIPLRAYVLDLRSAGPGADGGEPGEDDDHQGEGDGDVHDGELGSSRPGL
jgi:GNAT superfamily N-acetyltransferase